MLFKILKDFNYSPDGLTVVALTTETKPMPIRQDLQEGLLGAKLIEPFKGAAAPSAEHLAAVVIPADWAKLKPADQLAIAKALDVTAKTPAAAKKVIEGELVRRAALPA